MEILNLDEFITLKKEEEDKAKQYLANYWKTQKLVAWVDYIKENSKGNKFTIVKYPSNLNNDNVKSPFTKNDIDSCYINLNQIKDKVEEGCCIIFEFDINYEDKLGEDKLIKGGYGYIDVLTDYNKILEGIGINSNLYCDLLDEKEKEIDNIPFRMYELFKTINSRFIDEIGSKKNKYDEYTERVSNLENEFEEKKGLLADKLIKYKSEQKDSIDKDLKKYKDDYRKSIRENIKAEIIRNEKELEDLKKVININEERIKRYRVLGIHIDNNDKSDVFGRKDIQDIDSQIDYIQKYLYVKEGLEYTKDTIRRFYTALKTKQIIILSGPPGTGKTSLVSYFAEAIGAKAKVIPVQTNWSDNQDLLGFYNPVEKYYFSTPFLDALVEANENKDKLYFICLDEMNLARVEYYFSEFLSVLEKTKDNDKVLNLYSKFIYEDLKKKVDKISEKGKSEDSLDDEEKEIINQFNSLKRYPAEFAIPQNVRFIGTINADETTKEFSPKVIDRSLIIELLDEQDENKENIYKDSDINDNLYISAERFEIGEVQKIDKNTFKNIYDIKKELINLNIRLTRRFDKQISEFFSSYDWKEIDKFSDYIISSKILPKISVSYEQKTDENYRILTNIQQQIKQYPISSKKFNQMLERSTESKILTYWV